MSDSDNTPAQTKRRLKPSEIQIIRNVVLCKTCNTLIESKHVHDFIVCACGHGSDTAVTVDGGRDYLKRSWGKNADFDDMSVVEHKNKAKENNGEH